MSKRETKRLPNEEWSKFIGWPKACAYCGRVFYYRKGPGPKPSYCKNACKQAAYRTSLGGLAQ